MLCTRIQDFTWHLSFRDKTLDLNTSGVLKDVSCTLHSANDLVGLLELVTSCHICVGNPNMKIHHTTFMDPTGDYIMHIILDDSHIMDMYTTCRYPSH